MEKLLLQDLQVPLLLFQLTTDVLLSIEIHNQSTVSGWKRTRHHDGQVTEAWFRSSLSNNVFKNTCFFVTVSSWVLGPSLHDNRAHQLPILFKILKPKLLQEERYRLTTKVTPNVNLSVWRDQYGSAGS